MVLRVFLLGDMFKLFEKDLISIVGRSQIIFLQLRIKLWEGGREGDARGKRNGNILYMYN